jgi:hypothetical protein
MKQKLLKMLTNKIAVATVVACALTTVIISSCTKSPSPGPNYATQFIGTWTGTSVCSGATGNSSVTINAGSGTNGLSTSGTVGSGSCQKSMTESGTAAATSFSFPSQNFTDGCGNSYTLTVSGTLNGNTLTAVTTASGSVSATCTFTGTK